MREYESFDIILEEKGILENRNSRESRVNRSDRDSRSPSRSGMIVPRIIRSISQSSPARKGIGTAGSIVLKKFATAARSRNTLRFRLKEATHCNSHDYTLYPTLSSR